MNNHNGIVKEQLLHMVFGTVLFIALGALAVCLDLAAEGVRTLGVSNFTHQAIVITAHGMLVLDLVLFAVYLYRTSVSLVKEMFK